MGAKPPWNQPHEMPLALSRSPTFVPEIVIMLVPCNFGLVRTQSSSPGRGSPMTEPVVFAPAMLPLALAGTPFGRFAPRVAPKVFPEMRFTAPGVEGPNVVL